MFFFLPFNRYPRQRSSFSYSLKLRIPSLSRSNNLYKLCRSSKLSSSIFNSSYDYNITYIYLRSLLRNAARLQQWFILYCWNMFLQISFLFKLFIAQCGNVLKLWRIHWSIKKISYKLLYECKINPLPKIDLSQNL